MPGRKNLYDGSACVLMCEHLEAITGKPWKLKRDRHYTYGGYYSRLGGGDTVIDVEIDEDNSGAPVLRVYVCDSAEKANGIQWPSPEGGGRINQTPDYIASVDALLDAEVCGMLDDYIQSMAILLGLITQAPAALLDNTRWAADILKAYSKPVNLWK